MIKSGMNMMPRRAPDADCEDGAPPADLPRLYDMHFDDVRRWLRALAGFDADVDDLAQEVFIVAHRRFSQFDGRNAAGWLYQIARRVASQWRRRTWWRGLLVGEGDRKLETLPQAGAGPAELVERREGRQLLHRLLGSLTAKRRAVLVLSAIEGYSVDEIANLEGIKPATVFTRLHHARRDFIALVERERVAELHRIEKGSRR
jgi:RNA polymerase sigma-70 factor (ECF subfamily)